MTALSVLGSVGTAVATTGSTSVPVETDITIFKGEDLVITDTITGVNITGWTLAAAVATSVTAPVIFTVAGAITDAANGVFTITLTDTETDLLDPGRYVYDIKRTNAGSETVLTYGKLTVRGQVTA
jgi:hypothetical protein